MAWYAGLMSGTSLDGIDGVLVEFDQAESAPALPRLRAHVHQPFEAALRAELLALNQRGGADELHRAALAANGVARAYAGVVAALLRQSGLAVDQVGAMGAHGQTVRHRPGEFDATGYTVQLLNGALLAELSGIDVACDFRSRDVAAGGQGAPLVPAFHAACFSKPGTPRALLNLGGIANLTLLGAQGEVSGFDCGPANVLMDLWCQRQRGAAFDAEGAWAAGGRVDAALLRQLLAEPYFARQPPKSTGRDLFDAAWLEARLNAVPGARSLAPQDVMATLAELTAAAAAQALRAHAPGTQELLVCGGGAFNRHLLSRLAALTGVPVLSTAEVGVAPDQMEAIAFAWLARELHARRPGNLPAVTGARGPRLLGAWHPAT